MRLTLIALLRLPALLSLAMAAALSACGGGGDGSSTASPAAARATQQSFESMAIAQNGGRHVLSAFLSYATSTTGTPSLNTSTSFFLSEDFQLTQSPASAGPQAVNTGYTSLSPKLSVPTFAPQRLLVNGAVLVEASPQLAQVSYSGQNVQWSIFANDGTTPLFTIVETSIATVPLSGAIANSPSELLTGSALSVLTNTVNGVSPYNQQAVWQAGAAYQKVVRQYAGNALHVNDCATPYTTGTSTTPCITAATTLEGFFPRISGIDGKTYNLKDGQIVTLMGVRAWVSNTPIGIYATPQYIAYYESGGHIYRGVLIKDGTVVQRYPSNSTTPQSFTIYLNGAAVQSISAALTL